MDIFASVHQPLCIPENPPSAYWETSPAEVTWVPWDISWTTTSWKELTWEAEDYERSSLSKEPWTFKMCLPCWQRWLSHSGIERRTSVPEPQLLQSLTWAPKDVVLLYTSANWRPLQVVLLLGLSLCLELDLVLVWRWKDFHEHSSFLPPSPPCFAWLFFAILNSWNGSPWDCWRLQENWPVWGGESREEQVSYFLQ